MDGTKFVAVSWTATVTRTLRAFFEVKKDDTVTTAGLKVGNTAMMRIIYGIADYWLMAASAVFIIVMDRQFGYGATGLFLLMWAFDLVVANAFVALWQRTGKDITLGESYRRAADVVAADSPLGGRLAFGLVFLKATFWDGPEHIVIFFHKEIRTEARMLGILFVLTALQAAIWTPIYVLGFDSLTQLVQYLVG